VVTQALAVCTFEDARALVGQLQRVSVAAGPVNASMIKFFASAAEDANPSYWDEDFAEEVWGGLISPPSMLLHWLLPPPWSPGEPSGGYLAPQILMSEVPLPGDDLVNISVDYEYRRPVRVGDVLRMVEELIDVSPEKTTRIGTGHFITTSATFLAQGDEVVATQTNVLFRFTGGGLDA
jgi:acyl dehydratase